MGRILCYSFGLTTLFALSAGSALAANKEPWTEIRRESGVIVEERSWPEKSLVEFRGVTIIDTSIVTSLQFFSMTNSRLSGWTGSPNFGWSEAFNKRRIRMYNRIRPFALSVIEMSSSTQIFAFCHSIRRLLPVSTR